MKRDRLMMFGAITALTLSLVWAAQLMPGGMPGIPGLLSIGSVVKAPSGSINFDNPREKRCNYDVRAEMIQENVLAVRERARNIRIEVENVRESARRHNIVVQRHEHKHQHRRKHRHPHERKRCRSRMTLTQPASPIPPIPPNAPVPPIPPLAPMAPTAPAAPAPPLAP